MHRLFLEEKLSIQKIYSNKALSTPLQTSSSLTLNEEESTPSNVRLFLPTWWPKDRTGLLLKAVIQNMFDHLGPQQRHDGAALFWPGH
jgi:hypothetical protein